MDSNETNQSEKTFYQDQNVLVTQSRFVANGKTYAMRNISSVSNFRIKKSGCLAAFFIIIGFPAILAGDKAMAFGIIMVGIGIVIWINT